MAKNTEISWTHHSLNIWWGCTSVHTGCDNCYAKALAHRWGQDLWGNDVLRLEVKSWKSELMKFQKAAFEANEIHKVFVGSMMDIFEKSKPLMNRQHVELGYSTGDLREEFFNELVPQCPNLLFLLLTKRPSNINKYIPENWKTNPPKNVMFGTSPVDQETADKLIPQLLEVNGFRFLSVEPQLDIINLKPWLKHISQVIVGGESGHGKRPFNPDWARIIRDDCKEAGIAFFMKQWDKVKAIPEDLMIREFPDVYQLTNISTMKTENITSNEQKLISTSPVKMVIEEALLSGEKPEELAIRLANERSKPLSTMKAYVAMVLKLLTKQKGTLNKQDNMVVEEKKKSSIKACEELETKTVRVEVPEGNILKLQIEIILIKNNQKAA
jgi:protein gp37